MNKTFILHDSEYKIHNPKVEEIGAENAIPLMTSDTLPFGQAFSDSLYSTAYPSYYAFDDKINTAWASSTSAFPHYIGYRFTQKKIIVKYEVQIRSLDANDLTTAPNSWTFEGSNDNSTWTVLDTRSGQTWRAKGEIKEFAFNNSTEYLFYRLKITSHNGFSTPATSVGNFRMYGKPTPYIPANWTTISSTLPTQEQFLSDGMVSLSPLLDRRIETLEPLPMTDVSSTELVNGEEGKVFSGVVDLKKYLDIRSMKVEAK